MFPYSSYQAFSDQDIADLWAALRTVTPAQTKVPQHELEISLINRRLMSVWNKLASLAGVFERHADQTVTSGRGSYLALGPGQCAQCHAPRNIFGATTGSALAGGGARGLLGSVPSLVATDLSRRGWTADLLSEALRTGRGLDGEPFKPPMDRIVATSTAFFSDEDRDALVGFLLGDDSVSSSTTH